MIINLANLIKDSLLRSLIAAFALVFALGINAQDWTPEKLPDGQPNITGMWNNVGATATPVEMPDEFEGRVPSADELAEFISRRDEARKNNVGGEILCEVF